MPSTALKQTLFNGPIPGSEKSCLFAAIQKRKRIMSIAEQLLKNAVEQKMSVDDYIESLIASRDAYQVLSRTPEELLSRAVNYACTCGYQLPSESARHPDRHTPNCPYRKLFQETRK
jgi:hypothetical protein